MRKAKRKCDHDSGQVFIEEVIETNSTSQLLGSQWILDSPFLPPGWEAMSMKGAHSLKHMAMRGLLSDQRGLTVNHFMETPWPLAKYLWDYEYSRRKSLYIWKIFATVYPQELNEIQHRYTVLLNPEKGTIVDYLKLLPCDTLEWAVTLKVSTEFLQQYHLHHVANIRNLIGLEIKSAAFGTSAVTMSDHVIRDWGELSRTGRGFKHLRVLVLRTQNRVSDRIFPLLDGFQSLGFLVVRNCPQLSSKFALRCAIRNGWEPQEKFLQERRLDELIDELHSDPDMGPVYSNLDSEQGSPVSQSTPLLECILTQSVHDDSRLLYTIYKRLPAVRRPKRPAPYDDEETPLLALAKEKPSKPTLRSSRKKDIGGLVAQFYPKG
ncbi:hypothetical protein FQN57_004300 [Myotisia sp. PD_48]|nr:hypothetical protein FQN57_004300 [Myotisia sp. PD_48]